MAPTQISAHALSTLPFSSPPSWLIKFCVTLHLPFFCLWCHAWKNLFACPSCCCIPVRVHFFIFLLFQLYITFLCCLLSFTLLLLSFCCSLPWPDSFTLISQSGLPTDPTLDGRYGQTLARAVRWGPAGTRFTEQSSCLWEDGPTPQARRCSWSQRSPAPCPARSEARGHQESPYHFLPGSRSFFIHLRNYPVTPWAVSWLWCAAYGVRRVSFPTLPWLLPYSSHYQVPSISIPRFIFCFSSFSDLLYVSSDSHICSEDTAALFTGTHALHVHWK